MWTYERHQTFTKGEWNTIINTKGCWGNKLREGLLAPASQKKQDLKKGERNRLGRKKDDLSVSFRKKK